VVGEGGDGRGGVRQGRLAKELKSSGRLDRPQADCAWHSVAQAILGRVSPAGFVYLFFSAVRIGGRGVWEEMEMEMVGNM